MNKKIIYWLLVLSAWGALSIAGLVFYYALDLPATDDLWKQSNRTELRVYGFSPDAAAGGGNLLLARSGRGQAQALRYKDLPPSLIAAVIAIEDRRFLSHWGLDPRGLARAMAANIIAGRVVQGGSTLTQQLAKNVFLTPERSFKRKVQELILAFWLETQFSKQDILALYLNRVYFGAGAYGVVAAAETYFGKPAQSLNIGEATILAGMLKAPSRLAPTRNLKGALARRRVVLAAMVEVGALEKSEAARWADTPPTLARGINNAGASMRYGVDWVLELLPEYIGAPRSDLDVLTSFDPAMQRAAAAAINKILNKQTQTRSRASQAAMVVMTPDGAIRAMVGGKSYKQSQFNRATLALRQPGSAFKPIVYMAALEAGLMPDSPFIDEPINIGDWQPSNYDDDYRGATSLQDSLAFSINTVAVQVSEEIGRGRVVQMARRLGITSPLRPHPSIALGAFEVNLLELTSAYAHFANGGVEVFPYAIEAAITSGGEVLFEHRPSAARRILSSTHIKDMNQMLAASVAYGTGRAARIDGVAIGGKTGTSQNWRDAWFVGFSGALVVGVWVGNDDNSPMDKISGSSLPTQIWHEFMQGESINYKQNLPTQNETEDESLLDRLFN